MDAISFLIANLLMIGGAAIWLAGASHANDGLWFLDPIHRWRHTRWTRKSASKKVDILFRRKLRLHAKMIQTQRKAHRAEERFKAAEAAAFKMLDTLQAERNRDRA